MRQCDGQMSFNEYIDSKRRAISICGNCVCRNCLYWWQSRCPYGECYDDKRAKENPYDKAHPDKPPRTGWSNWKTDQAYWCRGGALYPVDYCEKFVKYQGSTVEDCVAAPVQTFQDGYIRCSLMDSIGCEECVRRAEGKKSKNGYDCQYMTDTGCEKMVTAKNLILEAIAEGENIEMCREQCCIGCNKSCRYRCGQA